MSKEIGDFQDVWRTIAHQHFKKLQASLDSWQKRNTVFTVYTLTTFQVQTKIKVNKVTMLVAHFPHRVILT